MRNFSRYLFKSAQRCNSVLVGLHEMWDTDADSVYQIISTLTQT